MTNARLLGLVLLAWAWIAPSTPAQGGGAQPVILEIYYDQLIAPTDPEIVEVLAYVQYPAGSGPVSMGYPAGPKPVFITARGGNSNNLVPGQPSESDISSLTTSTGFIDVVFNYPEVGTNEDYRVSADGVALLIQYLRHHAADLNVDPDRITVQARSFGTIVSYSVALCEDRADPTSIDPVRHESSRMDYFVPRFGPSTLTCFSQQLGSWASGLSAFFFPGKSFFAATPTEKLEESAIWWLLNPRRFARAWTPPMFVVYRNDHTDVCSGITDVHSGLFGELMLEAMDDFAAATADYGWRDRSGAFSNDIVQDPSGAIIGWAIERMADDFDGLFLSPPDGAAGGDVSLTVFGALPGNPVTFFSGQTPGTFPLPGCPNLQGQLTDFVEIATVSAGSNGLAQTTFPVSTAVIGQAGYFHAVDLVGCESSNVIAHLWQ